jgi:predicted NAD-dependent protein-ADP-ribosyltransferase YbiA (DUF1768 family)
MSLHEQIKQYYPQYSDIQRYPAAQCACIRKTDEEWGILGNFYHAPIVVEGVTFDCTERLFHLMKFRETAAEGIKSEYTVRRGMIIKMHMKPMYKQHPEWFREDWGSMLVDAMRFCIQTKYEQCEAFRKELERSKGLFIVEDETKRNERKKKDADSWGVNLVGDHYVGPSLLGRLLMELRDTGKLDYTLPADAFQFIEHLK